MTARIDGCDEHAGIGEELRALALTALDRIEPLLDRVRAEATSPGRAGTAADPGAGTCEGCPVCAVLAALRGERSESAARLVEQLGDLVTVLRTALEEGGPAPAAPAPAAPAPTEPAPARRVQRIRVERMDP
jgi:hypothetical protein